MNIKFYNLWKHNYYGDWAFVLFKCSEWMTGGNLKFFNLVIFNFEISIIMKGQK